MLSRSIVLKSIFSLSNEDTRELIFHGYSTDSDYRGKQTNNHPTFSPKKQKKILKSVTYVANLDKYQTYLHLLFKRKYPLKRLQMI